MRVALTFLIATLLTTAFIIPLPAASAARSPAAADTHDARMQERINDQMAVADRHRFDLPRDPHRKPFATFSFLGVKEGMTVMDVAAYAGYTSEMLSAAVGASGKVYSQNTRQVLERYAEGYYERTMTERLANNRLPNVVLHICEYEDLGVDGQLDIAFLGNMLHDFVNYEGEEQSLVYLRAIFRALKPGGVLGITDHVGVAGRNNSDLHRMPTGDARRLLEEAGFVIEAESDLFANAQDKHDLMVYEESIYRRTDRFFFRARKPH